MADNLTHSLRSDARDNRDRILEAARELFSTAGLGVPMREIALHAGVGSATLYRRFPTKEALVTEAFTQQIWVCGAILDEALVDPDPWRGFCSVITKLFDLHARDRGLTAAFLHRYPRASMLDRIRDEVLIKAAELVRRAKATGSLRSDFILQDLILIIMANSGIRAASADQAASASGRFAALAIAAFRATPGAAPLPPAVWTPELMPEK